MPILDMEKQSQYKANLSQNKPNLSQIKAKSKPIQSQLLAQLLRMPYTLGFNQQS